MLEHSLMCFVQHRPTSVTCLGSGGGGGGGGLGAGEAEADAELDQQEPGGAGRQGAGQVQQLGTRLELCSAPSVSQPVFTSMEKAPTSVGVQISHLLTVGSTPV